MPHPSEAVPETVAAEQQDYVAAVDRMLQEFLRQQRTVLEEISPETVLLVDAIDHLSTGGKRMRAVLAYWGWRAAGGSPGAEEIVRAGAALELFQTAALVHDDIIDHSDTRRGQPAVHKRFEQLHAQEGWHQDRRDFGTMGGILAGDLCLSFSEAVFASIGTAPATVGQARRLFDLMRTEVMAGQFLDGLSETMGPQDPQPALERAATVIRYKSAKYSCEHPLLIGAALAGASRELVRGLREFGLPLGEAFQLRDDVLGVFGAPETTGKPAGDDLREGKRTILVALAQQQGTAEDAALLDSGLGNPELTEDQVNRLRQVIQETGALAAVEEIIASTGRQVQAALSRLEVSPEARAALQQAAAQALHRSA